MGRNVHGAKSASTGIDVQAQNFSSLALHGDFKGPAADLAVAREPLRRVCGVDGHVRFLAAERALDAFGDFHSVIEYDPPSPFNPGITRLSPYNLLLHMQQKVVLRFLDEFGSFGECSPRPRSF
jgi:hypothetical protein